MQRLNRDVVIAIVLLMACGIFFWATFSIRQPDYGVLMPSTWPRTILVALTILCAIYLVQSLQKGRALKDEYDDYDTGAQRRPGLMGWLVHWRNPLMCFGLFFLYLLTLPYLGTLIGGVAFVFTLMGALGGWTRQHLILHAGVALGTVGGMWTIFTHGLGVLLPPGEIIPLLQEFLRNLS
jgi:hypothetical protein